VLFRPQIEWLVRERDAVVADWQRKFPDRDAFEDRELEVTSTLPISLASQIEWLDRQADAHA
jgi:hypothetical protein